MTARALTEYGAIVDEYKSGVAGFQTKAQAWDSNTTADQAAADARPAVDQIAASSIRLTQLSTSYPPIATDVRAYAAALAQVSGDLQNLSTLDVTSTDSMNAWLRQATSDLAAAKSANGVVIVDLGSTPDTRPTSTTPAS